MMVVMMMVMVMVMMVVIILFVILVMIVIMITLSVVKLVLVIFLVFVTVVSVMAMTMVSMMVMRVLVLLISLLRQLVVFVLFVFFLFLIAVHIFVLFLIFLVIMRMDDLAPPSEVEQLVETSPARGQVTHARSVIVPLPPMQQRQVVETHSVPVPRPSRVPEMPLQRMLKSRIRRAARSRRGRVGIQQGMRTRAHVAVSLLRV